MLCHRSTYRRRSKVSTTNVGAARGERELVPHDMNPDGETGRHAETRECEHAVCDKITVERLTMSGDFGGQEKNAVHFSNIISTACLNSSHVLYSSGRSYTQNEAHQFGRVTPSNARS